MGLNKPQCSTIFKSVLFNAERKCANTNKRINIPLAISRYFTRLPPRKVYSIFLIIHSTMFFKTE